ncbi:hypothetical protein OH492_12965 [Vibrio chagasii]|nr:hypothetical protein [Vibrio chagasii]
MPLSLIATINGTTTARYRSGNANTVKTKISINAFNSSQTTDVSKKRHCKPVIKLEILTCTLPLPVTNQYQVVAVKDTRSELLKVLQIDVDLHCDLQLSHVDCWSWRQTHQMKSGTD